MTVRYAKTRTFAVPDRSKPKPMARVFQQAPPALHVHPPQYRAVARQHHPLQVRVLNDLASLANALNQRLGSVLENADVVGRSVPMTSGTSTEYFLQTDGQPVISLFNGLSVWFRPHVSNDEGPLTLKVDGTPTKPLKVYIGSSEPQEAPKDTLRFNTPALASYDSVRDIWAVGVSAGELLPDTAAAFDATLADIVDIQGQVSGLVSDTADLDAAIQQLESDFQDEFVSLEATISQTYVTQADSDSALTALEQSLNSNIDGLQADVNIIAGTRTNTNGEAASGIVLEATAGGAAGALAISALRDAQTGDELSEVAVSSDVFRFDGNLAVFGGTVQSDNFSPGGSEGWRLQQNGDAEFNGELSAMFATIGKFRSATSGERVEIEDDRISVYDENDTLRVRIGRL